MRIAMSRRILCAFLLFFANISLAPAADTAALAAALQARLEQAAADGFSGSVLVADGDRVLFEHGYGVADPAGKAAVSADTRFNLASTGKLFTTVAVLQLVQQGKLDLDAPVGRYLPDWPIADVRDKVSVRQLLLHTSGLGSFWGPDFEAMRARLQSLSDYRPLLQKPPAFESGSRWQYSNSGFQVLGLIVQAVSGEDYYDYVARHIFAAAGMRDTGYFAIDGQARGVAVPHKGGRGEDRFEAYAVLPEPRGGAAGGGYSTPRDLLRFHRALTGGKLLDAQRRELLFAAVDLPGPREGRPPHGLGMVRVDAGGDVVYGHPGGARGIGVDFRGTRDSGWALVLMSNTAEPFTLALGSELARIVKDAGGADLRFPMPPPRPRGDAAPPR
jgi:D-alanyl-D-alanine carboxypeptidase